MLDADNYDTVISGESVDVYKPNGQPLLMFRHNVLPVDVCDLARPALHKVDREKNDHRYYMASWPIGYLNCRKTKFTRENMDAWLHCLPFIRECNHVFRRALPSRYKVQRELALRTPDGLFTDDTAFTSGFVNTWDADHVARSPIHKDRGDLKEGFGVISVVGSGNYTGGFLIFPQYGVAVDVRTTDVLLCDVHEWHGNGPIEGQPGWERLAVILFYQTRMQYCQQGE